MDLLVKVVNVQFVKKNLLVKRRDMIKIAAGFCPSMSIRLLLKIQIIKVIGSVKYLF